jgi:hypothetical protein
MALVSSVDYAARRIYLHADTMDANLDMLGVYREVRALRRTNEAHRKYKPMLIAGGNIPKITGVTYTPAYAQLLYGCRIVPYNSSHKIRLVRDTFTDDGFAGRDCFDRVSLSPSVDVDIDVDVQEVEIRIVSVGGSNVITGDISTVLAAIPSASANATAVLSAASATPIAANIEQVNSQTITGDGSSGSPWGP